MSKRRAQRDHRRRLGGHRLSLAVSILIAAILAPPSAVAQDPSCTAAWTLDPGSILRRSFEAPPDEDDLVRLPIPAPGVLGLYVSGPVLAAPPRMSFLGAVCTSPAGEDTSWVRIRETPRELQLRVLEAGDLFVAVSSENPGVALDGYTLYATFAAERPAPDAVIALAADPPAHCQATDLPTFSPQPFAESRFVVVRRDGFTKDVDPWDDDDVAGLTVAPGVLVVEAPDVELDAEIHDGDGCTSESRVAEGPLNGSGTFLAATVHAGEKRLVLRPRSALDIYYELHVKHFALCATGADDHPDRPLCATALSWADDVTGTLGEDDEDHFTFTLAVQETVAVDLAGGDGVRGVLYDGNGQRLKTWGAGRLVRTLGPGRFYVRVAGVDGGGGGYTLRVGAVAP